MFVAAIVLTLALNNSATVPVPVTRTETLDVNHYEVTGLSPEHLILSFRSRPNPAVMATTRAGVSTRYDFAFGNGECRLMQVELMLDIDITYPRWREEGRGSEVMRSEWTRFIQAVEIHEQGHVDRFRDAADRLSERLSAIPPAASCQTIRRRVAEEEERFDHEVSVVQAAYERQTGFGRTQGARLRFR
ncbi:DUF922 domain-containing protein [Hyphobacterium sp.]|uniref:DUF922 domain-containing protein n=1 Tax=Hyphobacterium sp. TaxID=2004662 RepID=UPI003BAB5DD9